MASQSSLDQKGQPNKQPARA